MIIDWIRTNTNGIGTTINLFMAMLLGFGWLRTAGGEPWTDAQVGLVMGFVMSVLGLITQKTTVAATKVQERKQEAFNQGVVEGVRQMSSGPGDGRV